MFDKSKKQLDQTRNVVENIAGGVYKRIDENRELHDLLQQAMPKFMESHPWVESWLNSNDEFFCLLADALPPTQARFMPSTTPGKVFPRPWTGKNTCSS